MSGGTNGGGPVVAGDTVYAATVSGHVSTRSPRAARERDPPVRRAGTGRRADLSWPILPATVAWSSVGSGHQVEAFPTNCGNTCSPRWIGSTNGPIAKIQPSSSFINDQVTSMSVFPGGLVVGSGDGTGGRVSLACGTGGALCRPLVTLKGAIHSATRRSRAACCSLGTARVCRRTTLPASRPRIVPTLVDVGPRRRRHRRHRRAGREPVRDRRGRPRLPILAQRNGRDASGTAPHTPPADAGARPRRMRRRPASCRERSPCFCS